MDVLHFSVLPQRQRLVQVHQSHLLPVLRIEEELRRPVAQARQLSQSHRGVPVDAVVDEVCGAEPAELALPLGAPVGHVAGLHPDHDQLQAGAPQLFLGRHHTDTRLPLVHPRLLHDRGQAAIEGGAAAVRRGAVGRERVVLHVVPVLVVPEGGRPLVRPHRLGRKPHGALLCGAHEHHRVHRRFESRLRLLAGGGRAGVLAVGRGGGGVGRGRAHPLLLEVQVGRIAVAAARAQCAQELLLEQVEGPAALVAAPLGKIGAVAALEALPPGPRRAGLRERHRELPVVALLAQRLAQVRLHLRQELAHLVLAVLALPALALDLLGVALHLLLERAHRRQLQPRHLPRALALMALVPPPPRASRRVEVACATLRPLRVARLGRAVRPRVVVAFPASKPLLALLGRPSPLVALLLLQLLLLLLLQLLVHFHEQLLH
mmetsp:Transcript_30384/g.65017  ORF Transcript_30384/g.65017 Transcript_30384/m.65017 type:complete len:433 (+) Transcript_30384:1876-3174(+)